MRKTLTLFIYLTCGSIYPACAAVENTYWDGTGENDFYVQVVASSFPSNKAGATLELPYKTPGQSRYSLDYHNRTGQANPPTWLAGESPLSPSDINSGYLKLNENLDVKVIMPRGELVPFNWSLQGTSASINQGIGRALNTFSFGLEGKLSLVLRRDMIGGAVLLPRDAMVASIYRSMSTTTSSSPVAKNPTPAFRIFLKGQVIPTPVVCSINNEKVINVNFGDLNSADITFDGSRYSKEISLDYSCNSEVNLPVEINLIATNTSFSNDFIETTNADVGVVMKYESKTVKPWQSFSAQLIKGKGGSRVYFAPVKNPAAKTIATGNFTASATLVMMIQ